MEFIDLKAQYRNLKATIDARIQGVLEHAQFIMGPEVCELEKELARRIGSRHCITCASGTDALLIALMAVGVGAGDEVITTPFTFIATAEAIVLLGARPVFVDIDPRTYNLDATLLLAAITPQTRAIVPVSLYGQCADMDAINDIAAPRKIAVVEDGCQSFGATYRERYSCNLSAIGCTSFFPSKPLGCYGDGGACFTNDDALATRLRQIRVHGQDRRYHHPIIGVNARLDTLQAAILLAKLEAFDEEVNSRVRIGAMYSDLLAGVVRTPHIEPHCTSVFAQYTVEVDNRPAVQEKLMKQGIPTAIHYPSALHLQRAFASLNYSAGSFPNAEAAASRVLSLPMHSSLSTADQERVVDALKRAVLVANTSGLQ